MNAVRRTQRPPQSCQFGRCSIAIMSVIAFWYSILSMLTDTLDHSRLFAFTYACRRMRSCSMTSSGVSYATCRFVDSHLWMSSQRESKFARNGATYMELLRRRLCTSLEPAKSAFGAMISIPSTRRKVVENSPNSRTNRGYHDCGQDLRTPLMRHNTHLIINHDKVSDVKHVR